MDDGRPFSDEEFALYEEDHRAGFQMWVDDVARARGLTVPAVESLAMGRVFTGRQAAENGLVDGTGDLHAALETARRLAGVADKEKTGVWHLPEKQGLLSSLLGGGPDEVGAAARWMMYRAVRQDVQQVRQSLVGSDWHVVDPIYTD